MAPPLGSRYYRSMDPTVADWLNLSLRWIHLIAGIFWIGSSFYFIWLDNHLTVPERPKEGVEGELWMVHSGGFYQVERRRIGPGQMPKTLHWFKWEAAITWISGILLLSLVYYLTGGVYLVDPAVSGIGAGRATALGIGLLVGSWLVYDLLWQSRLGRDGKGQPATAISFVLVAGVVYGLCQVLSGRAAYMHVGAMLGTLMVANVWLRILPAQQQMIDATAAGREPDFTLSAYAKRRSVHNSYMTFPVLFIMLSNHYPATYGHKLNWLVLYLLILVGAGVRHVMIARQGSGNWVLAPVAAALVTLFFLTAPVRTQATTGDQVSFAAVRAVINQRCVPCHSAYPSDPTFGAAPAGVSFDTPESVKQWAERINVRAVISETMPLANKTAMTREERALLGRWIEAGARLK